jgi:hypothetical protein
MKLSEYLAYAKEVIAADGLQVRLSWGQFQVDGGNIPNEHNFYYYILRKKYRDMKDAEAYKLEERFRDENRDNADVINMATGGEVRGHRRAHWFRRLLIRELVDSQPTV